MRYAIFEDGNYVGFSTIPFESDNKKLTFEKLSNKKIDELEKARQIEK